MEAFIPSISLENVPVVLQYELLDVVHDNCLFVLPTVSSSSSSIPRKGKKKRSIMPNNTNTRKPALDLLQTLTQLSISNLYHLVEKTRKFVSKSTSHLNHVWNQEGSTDARGRGDHVGLKNMGCSCYMNSFLQQIYMEPSLREGLLEAQLEKPNDIRILTKKDVEDHPEELIGYRVSNRCYNGKSFEAVVLGYDPVHKEHHIQYEEGGGEEARLVLTHGRPNKESGEFRILLPELKGEEATIEVLRQVQRTLCYLKDSERRYFNPKELVEACKCLNLEFSVYQQNDASEFCDKLLDRLEFGLKTTPQGPKILEECLSGKIISQKLPKDCGHVYEREESFIRIELQIRGKENIEESLEAFVAGELMDGDNKVECELCCTKKAAIRRMCFGTLPHTLILHLKRFDLDFTTFETVKLNNRCAFPLTLNMKPYTKEGIAQVEKKNKKDDMEQDEEEDVLEEEYEYELKGVLVHSGVAQGGHYYSFICDRESGKWSKFDDEDVTPFDPANIEAECYGGMQTRTTSWHGVNNTMEMEMFSNALMLFYDRKAKSTTSAATSSSPATPASTTPASTTVIPTSLSATPGTTTVMPTTVKEHTMSVFEKEVSVENEGFMRNSYLLDYEYHDCLRRIVHDGGKTKEMEVSLTTMGVEFVLNAVLHSREKNAIGPWLVALKTRFKTNASSAEWFLAQVFQTKSNDDKLLVSDSWLLEYIFNCPDYLARQHFTSLVSDAMEAYEGVTAHEDKEVNSIADAFTMCLSTTIVTQYKSKMEKNNATTSYDAFFTLLTSCLERNAHFRKEMASADWIARFVFMILGSSTSPDELKAAYEEEAVTVFLTKTIHLRVKDAFLFYRAIGSMLAIPCMAGQSLLSYIGSSLTSELSPAARMALSLAFSEHCDSDQNMGASELRGYFRSCGVELAEASLTGKRIGTMLNKYGVPSSLDHSVNMISEEGFLSFYTHAALKNEAQVWKDLKALGFGDNLQRTLPLSEWPSSEVLLATLPPLSRMALTCPGFIEAAIQEDIALEAGVGIVVRVCMGDSERSQQAIRVLLERLHHVEAGWNGQKYVRMVQEGIGNLLGAPLVHQLELLEYAFFSTPHGLLSIAEAARGTLIHDSTNGTELARPAAPYSRSPPSSMQSMLKVVRIIGVVVHLYDMPGTDSTTSWLNANVAEWEWMHPWLVENSQSPALGGRISTHYRNPEYVHLLQRLSTIHNLPMVNDAVMSYLVEGAGTVAVNGVYTVKGEFDECPLYKLSGSDGKVYTLFRCKMPSGVRRFYLCIAPASGRPGTAADIDYYYAQVPTSQISPPSDGWKVWAKNQQAREPAPHLRIVPMATATSEVGPLSQSSNEQLEALGLDDDDDGSNNQDDDMHPTTQFI